MIRYGSEAGSEALEHWVHAPGVAFVAGLARTRRASQCSQAPGVPAPGGRGASAGALGAAEPGAVFVAGWGYQTGQNNEPGAVFVAGLGLSRFARRSVAAAGAAPGSPAASHRGATDRNSLRLVNSEQWLTDQRVQGLPTAGPDRARSPGRDAAPALRHGMAPRGRLALAVPSRR